MCAYIVSSRLISFFHLIAPRAQAEKSEDVPESTGFVPVWSIMMAWRSYAGCFILLLGVTAAWKMPPHAGVIPTHAAVGAQLMPLPLINGADGLRASISQQDDSDCLVVFFHRQRCRRCLLLRPLVQRLAHEAEGTQRFAQVLVEVWTLLFLRFSLGSCLLAAVFDPLPDSRSAMACAHVAFCARARGRMMRRGASVRRRE